MKMFVRWWLHEADWWEFWRPGSGVSGGAIAGGIVILVLKSLAVL